LLCHVAGDERRATAIGVTNMLNTGTAGVGVFLAGMLKRDFGLGGVFAGVGAILLLDAVLLFAGYYFFLRRDGLQTESDPLLLHATGKKTPLDADEG